VAVAVVAAVAAGTFIALQSGLIGVFGTRVPAITVALWVHVAGTVAALVGVVATDAGFHLGVVRVHPVGLLAGVFGVGIVTSVAVAVAPLGLGSTLAILTGTQLLLAFGLEAAGVLGPVVRFDPLRVVGAALIVAGVLLIFGRGQPAG
jgi:uncharacterized membrane protein YdcZ (DUF606 family)